MRDKIYNIDMTIQREQGMRKGKKIKYMKPITTAATKSLNLMCVWMCVYVHIIIFTKPFCYKCFCLEKDDNSSSEVTACLWISKKDC